MNILEKIITAKKESLAEQKNKLPLEEIKKRIKDLPPTRNFRQAISLPDRTHLIAEIKRTSPSAIWKLGSACPPKLQRRRRLCLPAKASAKAGDVVRIAQEYELAGASAISVLTEEKFFLGNLEYIKQVKKVCKLPVLRKDFIFDVYQIYQSRYYQADAFLLIATLLKKEEIERFISLGSVLGMDALVEVHNEEELEQVLNTSAKVIGINNRNLKDLTVDLKVTLRLLKKYQEVITSKSKIIVSESGIKTKKDVELLKNAGVNAVLIGETLMQSENIREKVKELGLT